MSREIEPKSVYWMVVTCPTCGRRTRASSMLRYWRDAPSVDFHDAEMMLTKGGGFGRITNLRKPLWPFLRGMSDWRARSDFERAIKDVFWALSRRLADAERLSRRLGADLTGVDRV